jgi:integrase
MGGGTIEGTGAAPGVRVELPGFGAVDDIHQGADPAAMEVYLDALDTASDEHAATHRPPNTTRSHANGWQVWEAFCAEKRLPIAAGARRGALRAFVHWLWEAGAAPSTIDSRLSAVAVTLRREHDVQVDRETTAAARRLLTDYVREAAERGDPERGRGKAAALLLPDLRRVSAACPETLGGIRDRALVLVGFAIAARRSELAGLLVRDVVDDPGGLVVRVNVTKTAPREVAVPYGSNPLTCPVRAWRAWCAMQAAALGVAEPGPAGPAFRGVDRHGRIGRSLSGQAVGEVVTRAGQRAGVTVHLTGHSVRAGMATSARQAGKTREAISATTGHAPGSRALDAYLRRVDRWGGDENALIGIGL